MISQGSPAFARYELKYVISEGMARAVRDFIQPHLEGDEFSASGSTPGYSVHSLYLDSPQLSLYRQTVHGEKNRFKLRMRFYDEKPDSPVFLEIKRRTTDVISKSRAPVSRQAAEAFLQGKRLHCDDLISQNGKSQAGLTRFCELCDRLDARPSVYVSYRREAFVHPTIQGLRVTFDRELVGLPYRPESGLKLPEQFEPVKIPGVISELKYSGKFPQWMARLVQTFNLQRQSVPKYIECVDVLPNDWLYLNLAAQLAS